MPLNIKNEEVTQIVLELVEETGETITEAVGEAVRARLEELRRKKKRGEVSKRLMEIGKSCASRAPKEWLEKNFDEELYDEQGLPR
jgi:hypothetical protein